jgi:hypothetical protein
MSPQPHGGQLNQCDIQGKQRDCEKGIPRRHEGAIECLACPPGRVRAHLCKQLWCVTVALDIRLDAIGGIDNALRYTYNYTYACA